MSERLGCSWEKGEEECERPLNSSKLASEKECESSSLEAEAKGEVELVRKVGQDEILMKQNRAFDRNAGTIHDDKTLQFAQELTDELLQDLGGVEGPRLSTIPAGEKDSDGDKSVDSA